MCDIVDGFKSQGDARTLIHCVEALMKSEDITASEACEKLGYKLSDYKDAQKLIKAWDPDFTKLTPSEASELSRIMADMEAGEYVTDDDIDW